MKHLDMNVRPVRYFALLSAVLLLCGCHINDLKPFTDYYIAFDTAKSSSTVINEAGQFAGSYVIHFCTSQRQESVSVTVEAIAGDGLKENIDYRIVTPPTVRFSPGVYDKTFIVEWLPHELDASKDNTLTLTLKDCSDSGICLGVPGPAANFRSLKISKTK